MSNLHKKQTLKIGQEIAFCKDGKIWNGEVVEISKIDFEVSNFRPHPVNKDAKWTSAIVKKSFMFLNYKSDLRWYNQKQNIENAWCYPESSKFISHLINKYKSVNKKDLRDKSNRTKAIQRADEMKRYLEIIQKIYGNYNEVWFLLKDGSARKVNVKVTYYDDHFYLVSENMMDEALPGWLRLDNFEKSYFLTEKDCLTKHKSVLRAKKESKIEHAGSSLIYYGDCGAKAIIYPNLKKVYFEYSNGLLETGWDLIPKNNAYKCFRGAVKNRAEGNELCLKLIDEMEADHLIEDLKENKW